MDGHDDVPLIDWTAATPPALGRDDGHDRLPQLVAERGSREQSMGDQLAQHGRIVVDGADRRRDGAPQRERVREESDPNEIATSEVTASPAGFAREPVRC